MQKFETYSGVVRLGGIVTSEVYRPCRGEDGHRPDDSDLGHLSNELTAPEIILLQAVHGSDAVVKAKRSVEIRRDTKAEYDRLAAKYGIKVVKSLFPNFFVPLPTSAPGLHTAEQPAVATVDMTDPDTLARIRADMRAEIEAELRAELADEEVAELDVEPDEDKAETGVDQEPVAEAEISPAKKGKFNAAALID